ncbi:hypothetical protein ACFVAF_34545 [Streptomyces sp. NPDC057596]|uniref:hypothetical protein n=1 Tax=unclassified Streptomyces TaxID=2593676 RepID=UPI0034449750
MPTIGKANLPIPAGADGPTVPAHLAALAEAIDPHLVQHVTDQAERDTLYASAPLHTLVTAENGSVWIKTSAKENVWATLYEPLPPWKPLALWAGVNASSGFVAEYRVYRGRAWLRGRVERADGNLWIGDGPTIAATPAAALPTSLRSWVGATSLGDQIKVGTCRLEATPTSIIWRSKEANGTPWVDITGSYWLD